MKNDSAASFSGWNGIFNKPKENRDIDFNNRILSNQLRCYTLCCRWYMYLDATLYDGVLCVYTMYYMGYYGI